MKFAYEILLVCPGPEIYPFADIIDLEKPTLRKRCFAERFPSHFLGF